MCLQRVLRGKSSQRRTLLLLSPCTRSTLEGGGGRDVRQEPVQAAELCAGLEGGEGEGESKKDERIKGVRDALCHVMTALCKLPAVEGV